MYNYAFTVCIKTHKKNSDIISVMYAKQPIPNLQTKITQSKGIKCRLVPLTWQPWIIGLIGQYDVGLLKFLIQAGVLCSSEIASNRFSHLGFVEMLTKRALFLYLINQVFLYKT